jgi:transposase
VEVIYERCCGLDVHKATVFACLKVVGESEIRKFGTTTQDLHRLAQWLVRSECTHVGLESTGSYWKPIYNVLETTGMVVEVINATHIKIVPGRKSDTKDAEWICDVYRHGLVRGSFVPDRPMRELRELVRYRRSLTGDRAAEINRIQKVLEGANIKLASVVHDILGVSSRAMLEALIRGETDPEAIVAQVRTGLRADRDTLRGAVEGLMGSHQRELLAAQLARVDSLKSRIVALDQLIQAHLAPSEPIIQRLDTIPGVGRITAQEIIAAIGTDMSRFPSSAHLASWAKLCPSLNESAGKRKSSRTGKGSPFLRATLVEAARSKDSYLRSQYYRIKARRGANRATVAVAHTILVIAYHVIRDGTEYRDLGSNYLEAQSKDQLTKQYVRRLERLGHAVTLASTAEPAA